MRDASHVRPTHQAPHISTRVCSHCIPHLVALLVDKRLHGAGTEDGVLRCQRNQDRTETFLEVSEDKSMQSLMHSHDSRSFHMMF